MSLVLSFSVHCGQYSDSCGMRSDYYEMVCIFIESLQVALSVFG